VAECPGNVVDEDVLAAKKNGGTKDRIRKAGFLERPLEKSLPAKVFKRGILRRIVMLTWTTRETAARRDALKRARVLSTACEYRKSA